MSKDSSTKSSLFLNLCGRIFRDTDPAYFPRAEYRGRTIYLCTESCLGAFRADPDVFHKVQRNSPSTADGSWLDWIPDPI